MTVSFEKIVVGIKYSRPYLAKVWGYGGFQAISRGVVTPSGSAYIILFVTEEKQESLTQYNDFLVEGKLHWEGEKKHGSDQRIINAGFGPHQIHLFHRRKHHTDFTYCGRIYLEQHYLRVDAPSQFIFYLSEYLNVSDESGAYDFDLKDTESNSKATERAAITASRIGQGIFRDGLFRVWGSCAVTGYERPQLLIASHTKPWGKSTDIERLDPFNGLLLQPTIDKLFDVGLVTFTDIGEMVRSSVVNADELIQLGIDPESKLSKMFPKTRDYLRFHREMQFERRENEG